MRFLRLSSIFLAIDETTFLAATAGMTGGMTPASAVVPQFAGSQRLRPDGRPTREFRDQLRQIDNRRNAFTVAHTLATPVFIVWAAITIDHWAGWIAAFGLMGSVFARFAILNHEAAHRLLFSNRRINDFVGQWVFGLLAFGSGSDAYRRSHAAHHRDEFGPNEPDFLLYALYPIPVASWRRKLRRDALFVSGAKNFRSFFRSFRSLKTIQYGLRTVAGQLIVLTPLLVIGRPELWLYLWLVPYMTIWRVFNRLRAVAEHAGLERSPDRRLTTHHVEQSWLPRFWFVPFNTGWHLAHHVDSGIGFRNLPVLHRALVDDGYLDQAMVYPTYRSLWSALTR